MDIEQYATRLVICMKGRNILKIEINREKGWKLRLYRFYQEYYPHGIIVINSYPQNYPHYPQKHSLDIHMLLTKKC